MTLELTKDEALVLFELLAGLDEGAAIAHRDPAEERVLWSLQAQLEKQLVEPFQENYRELLAGARTRVVQGDAT